MSLSQSLFSAISGLINHQTRLDNVGNNLANINTTGYKRSVLRFQDVLSQTTRGGRAPDANRGGTNPIQVGLGMQVASVDQDFGQGGLESTGRASDLAIEGDGFFKVTSSDRIRYTRDGAFTIGQAGDLVTSNGMRVQGWMADQNGLIDTTLNTENIIIPLGEKRLAKETGVVNYTGNLNSAGSEAAAGSALTSEALYSDAGVLVPPTPPTDAVGTTALDSLYYDNGGTPTLLFPGLVVGNNITVTAVKGNRTISTDIAYNGQSVAAFAAEVRNALGIQTIAGEAAGAAFVDAVAATPGPPPTPWTPATLNITGNLGDLNAISQVQFQLGASTTSIFNAGAVANGESAVTTTTVYDSLGNAHLMTMTMVLVDRTNNTSTWRWYADCADDTTGNRGVGNGTVVFDSHGQFSSESGSTASINLTLQGVATALVVDPNFELLTQFATTTGSELNVRSQDGAPMGVLSSYAIAENGIISGLYTNGLSEDLGRICITRFANNNGLTRDGENMFSAGRNSGLAQDGEPLTSGRGAVRAGTLESSNVDMAKEFTDMIVTQRGFQANARTITTSDQMLQELINLIR